MEATIVEYPKLGRLPGLGVSEYSQRYLHQLALRMQCGERYLRVRCERVVVNITFCFFPSLGAANYGSLCMF